ncbi:hypothetical protein Pyn_03023 [Prunus yedoensis var. nudiflora]|uniref:Uncharacterized protein n=1 Tax=Prunus yedoensis var. nudiflora TaxID=2094558 RepID=A0A314YEU0_PRUYE|nr:hypothetical protein Pyn_03023 [Prunus yedoensis var. nudiflora]
MKSILVQGSLRFQGFYVAEPPHGGEAPPAFFLGFQTRACKGKKWPACFRLAAGSGQFALSLGVSTNVRLSKCYSRL